MRADRLLRLLMLLQRHRRATAGWLAGELEVSVRTVLRDMEALSAAGVPVYTERGNGGGCVLMEGFTTQASGLTPAEAQALFAWAGRESTAELGLGADLAGALAKVAATAPSVALRDAEALGGVVLADRRRWFAASEQVPWLPMLREATTAGRRVRVSYQAAHEGAPRSRTLHPIGLVDHSGRWYLVAEHRRRLRTYRVSRFTAVSVLEAPVNLADRRPLADVWSDLRRNLERRGAPVDVTVSVLRDSAGDHRRLLSMQLAAGTTIDAAADPDDPDREIWRLTIRDTGVLAAVAVLAVPRLTVIEPEWMIPELRAAAERTLAHYAPSAPEGAATGPRST